MYIYVYVCMYTNSVSAEAVYSVIASSRIIAVGAQQLAYLLQVFDDEPSSYSRLITDITSTGCRRTQYMRRLSYRVPR